jgi:hypothetical protein
MQDTFRRFCCIGFLCLLFVASAAAQNSDASVSFTFDFPRSQPDHYVISVNSDGHTSYVSSGRFDNAEEPADPFKLELVISPATSARIFDLARRADYFQGSLDSKKKNLALTGAKTLAYHSAGKSGSATYNYSQNKAVQDLTSLFQDLSTTLEFGRRLEFYHQYQKLGLDEELKRLEDMAKGHSLEELSALSPILQQIAQDPTVINPVRSRAEKLLALAAKN